jgi:catechol 2,3-dioxygenase-like lactoylglutathione lyase family enzyme
MKGLVAVLVFMSVPLLLQSGQTTQTPVITVGFEHLAFNVADPRAVAKWYSDNLGMKIVKSGGAPSFNHFLSDTAGRMMFELYHTEQAKVLDFKQIEPDALHVAFEVSDVQAMTDKLLKVGATVAKEIRTSDAGDVVITLRDPWGLPIQFLKRSKPMLTR